MNTIYGISVSTWLGIIEWAIPIILLAWAGFLRYRKNETVKKYVEIVFPFLKSFEPVVFRDRLDASPHIQFARAKNIFTIVFNYRIIVPDLQPFLNLLMDGVTYAKDINYYIYCLDLTNVHSIDDNGIIAIVNVMTRVLQYNGVCLDIILPESGDKINILAGKLNRLIDADRQDVRVLSNMNLGKKR